MDYCQCFSDSWIFFFIPLISSYYAQLFLNQPDSLEHVVYWLGVWICTRRLHECCSLCACLSQLCYLHLQQSLQHFGFKPSMPKQPSCQASKQTNKQTNKQSLPWCSLWNLSSNFGPNSLYYVLFPNIFLEEESRPNIYCIYMTITVFALPIIALLEVVLNSVYVGLY